ncbi:MAG: sulfatase family protein [Kiritimatiellia bacterium]
MSVEQRKPNVLFIMTDQQRFDTIAALGKPLIYTPNLDRLVRRGIAFVRAYSTCPVCVPARYTIRTGCEPPTTLCFSNDGFEKPTEGQSATMTGRCGPYLAQRMAALGYRTFGIGKFHCIPWDEPLGYEVQLHSEELYGTPERRARDAYAAWIATEHPEFDFLEHLMGERTEMYSIPQMSPLPAELNVERWAADRAVWQITASDPRPFFGMVSFVGPHPPLAPPIPFNRLYNPDRMPNPVKGQLEVDHMDEQIPWVNYAVWAEEVSDSLARVLKARYYGEITYIDDCLGRILDAVEKRPDADNTLICFFSDHGDLMGDHHGWQKENFFEAACRIPFLVSWPARLPTDQRRDDLVCLTDLFGLATAAAGFPEIREGIDLLSVLEGRVTPRQRLVGWYGSPGTRRFKLMVREGRWKYIWLANGGREQLFDAENDPAELINRAPDETEILRSMRAVAIEVCDRPGTRAALDGNQLRSFSFQARPLKRLKQFESSRAPADFPHHPVEVLKHPGA